jgi:tetratricopeptide (TPR) repeat protein
MAQEMGYRYGEAVALNNLGNSYRLLGDLRQAIEYHQQSQRIAHEIGYRDNETDAAWDKGLALEQAGELEQAVVAMQPRVDYLREIRHVDAEKYAEQLAALRARLKAGGG